jgi:hypothetical protein
MTTSSMLRIMLAAAAGVGCLFLSEKASLNQPHALVTTAEAIIGRPLTPMSYAGVARRTTARAVTYGAAAGAVAVGAAAVAAPVVVAPAPVVVAPVAACVQVVNVYGQISYRCP